MNLRFFFCWLLFVAAALPAQAGCYDIMAALFSDTLGKGHVRLRAGKPVRIAIEMVCQPGLYHVLRFGNRPPEPPDLLDRAIAAARAADVVVLMVGTNQDIETESQERDTTSLPGPQDEIVERVLDAKPVYGDHRQCRPSDRPTLGLEGVDHPL